ncbi:hypothetical protein D9M71_264490 [compost metagenome]
MVDHVQLTDQGLARLVDTNLPPVAPEARFLVVCAHELMSLFDVADVVGFAQAIVELIPQVMSVFAISDCVITPLNKLKQLIPSG